MDIWQEELVELLTLGPGCPHTLFERIQRATQSLGFDYVGYGFQAPLPLSQPKVTVLNNYPSSWQQRYTAAGYIHVDPTVSAGRKRQAPLLWNDALFANAPSLWDEAQQHGLRVGWAQSVLDGPCGGGMLTLARSGEPLSACELKAKQAQMCWLAHLAHVLLSRAIRHQPVKELPRLSEREREVLRWTGDGKSAQDISDILGLSKNTIEFHIKNSVVKLQAPNKTAAVLRAALLGLLD